MWARHQFFPLGLNCTHCRIWHALEPAIAHIEQLHGDCMSCRAEQLLCRALLEDEQIAEQAFREGQVAN